MNSDDDHRGDASVGVWLPQPLRSSYRSLVVALTVAAGGISGSGITSGIAPADELPSPDDIGIRAWSMRAIQSVTTLAPPVRHTATATSTSSSLASARVLDFLSSMLTLFRVRPDMLTAGDHQHGDDADAAAAATHIDATSRESLLSFLYAQIYRYSLHLGDYDRYYQILRSMPNQFNDDDGNGDDATPSSDIAAVGHMKLEYLRRFVRELLRESRRHDVTHRFHWGFTWRHALDADASSSFSSSDIEHDRTAHPEGRTVSEEVQSILWWNARSSDIADASASASSSPSAIDGGRHYEILYAFLTRNQQYLQAAQSMYHLYTRLECEATTDDGVTDVCAFVASKVATIQRGRGRSIAQQNESVGDYQELTRKVVDTILQRKFRALTCVRDALIQAAASTSSSVGDRRSKERFMFEGQYSTVSGDADATSIDARQQASEGASPLHKKLRARASMGGAAAMDDGDASIDNPSSTVSSRFSSAFELLSLRDINARLELLISQCDLLASMSSHPDYTPPRRVDESAAVDGDEAPVSEAARRQSLIASLLEYPTDMNEYVELLMEFGLSDRAFHLLATHYDVTPTVDCDDAASDEYAAQRHRQQQHQRVVAFDSNPRRGEYESAIAKLFSLYAERVTRMYVVLDDDEFVDGNIPLAIDDSLQSLQLDGIRFASTASSSIDDANSIALKEAEGVMQLYIRQFDLVSMLAATTICGKYLSADIAPPIWLQAIFTRFMLPVDDNEEAIRESTPLYHVRSPSARSSHASSVTAFPFISFIRLLLAHNRFELLFHHTVSYLDWIRATTTSAIDVDVATMMDIVNRFIFLDQFAGEAARDAHDDDAVAVRAQTAEWLSILQKRVEVTITKRAMPTQQRQFLLTSSSSSSTQAPPTSSVSVPPASARVSKSFAPVPTFGLASSTSAQFRSTPVVAPSATASPFAVAAPVAAPATATSFGVTPTPTATPFGFGIASTKPIVAPSFTPFAAQPFAASPFASTSFASVTHSTMPSFTSSSPFAFDQSSAAIKPTGAPVPTPFGGGGFGFGAPPATAKATSFKFS